MRTYYFSNTELSIESIVTRHRRQFRNCNCCHCQNHNNYLHNCEKSQETGMVKTLPSPTNGRCEQRSTNPQTSQIDSQSSVICSNFNTILKDSHNQSNHCTHMNGKESYLCLHKRYLNFLQYSASAKDNKKFLSAKEDFKKSLSNFYGVLYRYFNRIYY